jgi:hypothetical protein
VAGLKTGDRAPDPAAEPPSIQWLIRVVTVTEIT